MKLTVNGRKNETCSEGNFLRLKLQSTGIIGHCTNVRNKGNAVYINLRKFKNLPAKIKITLIKTLSIAFLEYPPIPICATSLIKKKRNIQRNTKKRNIQTVLNKGFKFIECNEDDEATLEQLHKYYITLLNISIDKRAKQTWEAIRATEPGHYII